MVTLKNKKEIEKLEKNIAKKEKEIAVLKKEIETLSKRYNELLIDELKSYSVEANKSIIEIISELYGAKNVAKVEQVSKQDDKIDLDKLIDESEDEQVEQKENEFDVTSVLGNITSGTRGY